MKTWMMPQVVVEAFRANEYCSSCYEEFKTNEEAILAILSNKNGMVDFDGSTGGWGSTAWGNTPPYPGQFLRGQPMNEWQWNNWPHSAAYTGWLELATESTTQAAQYKEQGLILDYDTSGGHVWGKVYVYWIASNSGTNHWHPSTQFTEANHS